MGYFLLFVSGLATLSVVIGLSSNPAEAQPFAYVMNTTSGAVSVIDKNPGNADFNKVVSTIEVGEGYTDFIAYTPDGSHIYVVVDYRSVVVVDTDPGFRILISPTLSCRLPLFAGAQDHHAGKETPLQHFHS